MPDLSFAFLQPKKQMSFEIFIFLKQFITYKKNSKI